MPDHTRTARLELTICIDDVETVYNVQVLDPDQRIAHPAFNLTKADGEVYHVSLQQGLAVCTCAAFTFCKEQPPHCKHIDSLRKLKLLANREEGDFPP